MSVVTGAAANGSVAFATGFAVALACECTSEMTGTLTGTLWRTPAVVFTPPTLVALDPCFKAGSGASA